MKFPAPTLLILLPALLAGAAETNPFPDLPPTEPEAAMAKFEIHPDFELELVASEPLIADPVAMSFDENGALYVVEMRGYSERREDHLGRVKRLEDRDHDGRMDHATTFAEGLAWPTGVMCYDGGVFVIAAPDLWFFRDTNGDGMADEKQIVLTGFAGQREFSQESGSGFQQRLNVQQLPNNIRWGIDQKIHIAEGGNGSRIRKPDDASGEALELRGRDLVLDPRTMDFAAENGGGQFGMTFDDVGHKFISSNSDHLQAVLYERIAAPPRTDRLRAVADGTQLQFYTPFPRRSIAADGTAAPVFRISPDEAWRVVRTRWRVAGQVSGPIEGGGRPSGYFTGATGIQIYRGDLFPDSFHGNAFIADVGSNLIHRKGLRPDRESFIGERAPEEQQREFLASTDNWFRPVQLENGPDGALYILDFYRELIEHPWSLPPGIKEHLDLNRGNERGRIWRVLPKDTELRRTVALGSATTAELVDLLEHPNGWHRDTASRLLIERDDPTAIDLLRKQAGDSQSAVARIHSLALLKQLGGLENNHLRAALGDENSDVREYAVRLAGDWLPREELFSDVWLDIWLRLTKDSSAAVRWQLQITLAGHPSQRLFESILENDGDLEPHTYFAFGLIPNFHPKTFSDSFFEKQFDTMTSLTRISATRADADRITDWVGSVAVNPNSNELNYRLLSIISALAPSGAIPTNWVITEAIRNEAIRQARIALNKPSTKRFGFSVLNSLRTSETDQLLVNLLPSNDDLELQTWIVTSLARRSTRSMFDEMLDRLPELTPMNQSRLLHDSTYSADHRGWLFERIESDPAFREQLGIVFQNFLRNHRDETIRDWAAKILPRSDDSKSIEQQLKMFEPALQIDGDTARGGTIYQQRCATCHRAGGPGPETGPNLVTVSRAGRPTLLQNILDPNREINSSYEAWQVILRDGTELLGRSYGQSENSFTLLLADGSTVSVPREGVIQMRPTGRSLMPEGLAQGLNPDDMADLLRFIEDLANPTFSPTEE